jgi:thiamine biosynthesis lipoprotein
MSSAAPIHVFRHEAMATTFELRLVTPDAPYAAQAAHECFALLDRLHALLSRYDEGSEISALSRLEPGSSLRLSAEVAACLRIALEVHTLTGGAFDPTLGDRLDAVRGRKPSPAVPAAARGRLELDPATSTARVLHARVALDLGAIGKGFALDRMAATLVEWDLPAALLIGGEGSSVLALDGPAPGTGWDIGLGEGASRRLVSLRNHALGASGFAVQGAHILDPLTGAPAAARRAWALAPSAALADAVSTAAMVLSPEELAELCAGSPGLGVLIASPAPGAPLSAFGDIPFSIPLQP